MHTCTTAAVIEALVHADSEDVRRQYVLRQALHGLVRQAKSEQMLEIRTSVTRLAGVSEQALRRRGGKRCQCDVRQQQLEFGQDEAR